MLSPDQETICKYDTKSVFGTIVVYSSRAGGIPEYFTNRALRGAREGLSVEGIGDEAYFKPSNGITVFIGDDYFQVGTQRSGQDAERAERLVKGLARAAVGRLAST